MLNYQRVLEAQSIADVFESQRAPCMPCITKIAQEVDAVNTVVQEGIPPR